MKSVLAALAAAGLVAAGVGIGRQRRRVDAVAPDLRTPQLYAALSMRNDAMLRFARNAFAKAAPPTEVADGVDATDQRVPAAEGRPEVPVVVYEPDGRSRPSGALLWIHGGGFVMGDPGPDHEWCSKLAAEAGILVVSVDYRLAPEDPFPAGLDDCLAALAWLHEHAGELGVDPARVAIGGGSAGGGLAACLAQRAHDLGGPPVCFQLLVYPMLDDRTALRTDAAALVWTNTSNRYAWSAYLGSPAGQGDPPPHAVAARRGDLTGLPPAWIGIGDIDLFHDEAVAYAERLRDAGVDGELHVVPGMYHAAERFVPDAPATRDFVDRAYAAVRAAVGDTVAAG